MYRKMGQIIKKQKTKRTIYNANGLDKFSLVVNQSIQAIMCIRVYATKFCVYSPIHSGAKNKRKNNK